MNDELERMWKEAVLAQFKVRNYPGICLEELRKPRYNINQDSQSPG
jgi:hypothetical protein